MQEVIKYGTTQEVAIENEKVGEILLRFQAKSDVSTACNIADLNEVSLTVSVMRKGGKVINLINGYLDDILSVIYGGSTGYGIATTKLSGYGYDVPIPLGGALNLREGDKLIVKCNAPISAFTSLDTAFSEITIESMPSKNSSPFLNCIEEVPYKTGVKNISEMDLGSRLSKVVLVNDLTANYGSSSKAKPTQGIRLIGQGFKKDVSERALLSENNRMLFYATATAVRHLVIFSNEKQLLNKGKLTALLDKAVDSTAKIMVIRKKAV